ncbi:MFS transporter [Pseudonocardia kujensis]|uniref:MFS transporter n=1 Tax=Pseudonocardia kujensis TaxID=1128675 RepID=UPI001E3D38D2|nr:MFS transporter [Pseudonocardia kujensis]MCE0763619.1 MFS transporter [Pseudonocardia kujensis]
MADTPAQPDDRRESTAGAGGAAAGAGPRQGVLLPLYAAGFVTAFGSHAVATGAGAETGSGQLSVLALGLVLAVYDGAEILLKPVFGSLADRVGPRRVLLGGLAAFAAVSLVYVLVALGGGMAAGPGSAVALTLARLGQGAAASAFSPAAGAMVGRLGAGGRQGRVFGSYGAWKGLGYTAGPLIGGVVLTFAGFTTLFVVLAAVAVAVTVWAALSVPAVPPLPRQRQTVVDLARRLSAPGFLRPTAALAGTTAALATAVGFLPALGTAAGLSAIVTGAVVGCLALSSTLVQPRAGRAHDRGRLSTRTALAAGFALMVAGFVLAATVPGIVALVAAAVVIGLGVGVATPVAFASLAASSPPERLGQTMGSAEVGRELGDAGGPLLVGVVAAAASVAVGLGALAAVLAVVGTAAVAGRSAARPADGSG